jgi:signal transduction histidine kinase
VQDLTGVNNLFSSEESVPVVNAGRAAADLPGIAAAPSAGSTAHRQLDALRQLANLLLSPSDAETRLRSALEIAARLVPAVISWQLYTAESHGRTSLSLLCERPTMTSQPVRPGGHGEMVSTLGFGPAVDRQVLQQHQIAVIRPTRQQRTVRADEQSHRVGATATSGIAAPIMSSAGALSGVLVCRVPGEMELSDRDRDLIDVIVPHLGVIIEQRTRQHQIERSPSRNTSGDERMSFISLAAHELRSPLTSVKGYAQLLLRAARKDQSFPRNSMHALQAIEQQASRMSDMVAELLDASRIQRHSFEVHPRLVDLTALVRHAIEHRRPSLERHELILETDDQSLSGQWDPPRVEQVVRDLIDNAVRYSPDGGPIYVRLARVGDGARVCVRDEGIGVPEAERAHIFDSFFRGATAQRRNLNGLGLGLFVSRAIIEESGGRIWLEPSDAESRGTTICFELPLGTTR